MCFSVHMQNAGSVCPFSMLAVYTAFGIWQPYLFSDICEICVFCSLLHG